MIENEQTKLTATALNNLAVAIWVAGIVGPAVAFLYGSPSSDTHGWWFLIGVAWFSAGFALHMLGRTVLRRLKP
jgi:ABC-type multidrug transport system permease subunit